MTTDRQGLIPMFILLCEVKKETGDSGVVGDELTIKVDEAKEGMYFLDFNRGWLSSDAVKLDQVHGKLTRFHDHSKVFDFRDVKLTLLEL